MRLPTQSSSVVAFSPDSTLMVFADIEKLRWVETGSWRTINELPRSALVGSLAFSPDGRMIATTDNESTVQLLETSSGRVLASLSANDAPTYVCWLAFHPDGNQLAVCRQRWSTGVGPATASRGSAESRTGLAMNLFEIPSLRLLSNHE